MYNSASGKLAALQLSKDGGATWHALGLPNPTVNSGGQAATNLAVAIDRTNPNIVYVAGDRIEERPFTVTAYRVVLNSDNSSTVEILTNLGATDGSTTHADARALAFDAAGRLILTGDGGIFVRTNPQGAGAWSGLNTSSLSLREAYAVAFDSVSKRLVVAAQDTGSAYQSAPGSSFYDAVLGGDGLNGVVNDVTLKSAGYSAFYTSFQGLGGLTRQTVDANGASVATHFFPTAKDRPDRIPFPLTDYTDNGELPFGSRIVLNKIDPTMIAFSTNFVHTAKDSGAASETLSNFTNLGTTAPIGPITALAYGTIDNTNALLAGAKRSGTAFGDLWVTTTGGPVLRDGAACRAS